jgi:O-methyltransferase
MRPKQIVARFFINCGLGRLYGGRLQKFIRSILDEIDLQDLRDSQPCRRFAGRLEMWRFVQEHYFQNAAIDYLEFGVAEGSSVKYWTGLNTHSESRFLGFDSFEGLPEDWRGDKKKGYFDAGGRLPRTSDPRVQFIKGWFENTIPSFVHGLVLKNRLLIHIDCDLYAGAMLALVYLTPFMFPGTILMFDEFSDRDNEFKAFKDWKRIYKKDTQFLGEVANCVQVSMEVL